MVGRYPVPDGETVTELVVKNSRFIARLGAADTVVSARDFIRRISAEHLDASHNCWAYVVGPPGSTGQIGMSDDGELHNTAGRPMLNVLLHAAVGDAVVVVTRYFGGVKLGRGGLVRAYGQAVKTVLEEAGSREKIDWIELLVTADYANAPAVDRVLPNVEGERLGETYGAEVELQIRIPRERREELERAIGDATRGQVVISDPHEP